MSQLRNCAKAIRLQDKQLLAIRYEDQGGVYFALPGGGQLHGETLPDTLVRECLEELGVPVINLGLRFIREYIGKEGESSWRDSKVHQVEFLFECTLRDGDIPRAGVHGDHTQVGFDWLPIAAISDFRFYPRELVSYLGQPFPDQIEYWGAVD